MAAIHDRGARTRPLHGNDSLGDDLPLGHLSQVFRNPQDAVRIVSHQAAGDERRHGSPRIAGPGTGSGEELDSQLRDSLRRERFDS